MPYHNRYDPRDWLNSLPIRGARQGYNPLDDPHFDVNKLKENEIDMGSWAVAKLPKIPDRIREKYNEENHETDIELITGRYRDEETGEIREETVRMGTDVSWKLPGMMVISEEYHNYFDLKGNLIYDPLGRKEAEEREKAKAEAAEKAAKEKEACAKQAAEKAAKDKEVRAKQAQQKATETVKGAERTLDEIRESLLQKERELKETLQQGRLGLKEIEKKKAELDKLIVARRKELEERDDAHVNLLRDILHYHQTIVEEQAKRKPDLFMKQSQIRIINEILEEIRNYFAGSEAEDYLHLAEEPREDDLEHHPGTTYSEMAILLVAYSSTLHAFSMERLYEKNDKSMLGSAGGE